MRRTLLDVQAGKQLGSVAQIDVAVKAHSPELEPIGAGPIESGNGGHRGCETSLSYTLHDHVANIRFRAVG